MSAKSAASALFLVAGKSCRNMAAVIAAVLFLGSSRADIVITAPSGLAVGDKFRIVRLTTETTNGTSADITTYNNVANATAYSYGGVTVSWKAFASTSVADGSGNSINARTNIGAVNSDVYRLDGVKISTAANFYTGNHLAAASTANPAVFVWTGSDSDGTGKANYLLGVNASSLAGLSDQSGGGWVDWSQQDKNSQFGVWAVSQELTVVPEPGTMLLASLAAACGGGGVWWRKRKTAKNQAEPEPQAEV
jgi:hypothetical protein